MSTLTIPTEGPCAGHPCDNCATCRKGRCCRRDNPDYKLPELGEWDGPIYGELGVLATDGDKVECHCCGEWFVSVANHAWSVHNLLAAEYRSIFGLNRRQGLNGPVDAARRRQFAIKVGLGATKDTSPLMLLTREQRMDSGSRPKRIQARHSYSTASKGQARLQGARRKDIGVSGYVGVHPHAQGWAAAIRRLGQQYHLGGFMSPEDAARVYDRLARTLYGQDARLNFPDDPWETMDLPEARIPTSSYRGVSIHTNGKWAAVIMKDRRQKHIGLYVSDEEAARAYDAKALELYGKDARLNFPEEYP